MAFELDGERIAAENHGRLAWLEEDYAHLGRQLMRRGVDIDKLTERVAAFRVSVPSWGVGTGGTRFARFAAPGEPRNVFEKIEDCEVVFKLVRTTPGISLHIPWDKPESPAELRAFAQGRGLFFDSMNSNTFQDQPGQTLSYKFGSLSHTDPAVRRQAVEHNLECLRLGVKLGARSHTVWIGDGGNFPGQVHFRKALDRYLESLRAIYAALPEGFRMFIEHKLYEPAFYSTVLNDWGTSYHCVRELGPQAFSLVDLGHHAPNVNIEMIVARLIQFGKLAGFHFNDSKYGDDDLDAGSIKPFQLFLIFNELVDAELSRVPGFDPAYMLDQSHNVTDPIESLATSAIELVRAYVQAHLVDRAALAAAQAENDALLALQALKQAFTTDVSPILGMARYRAGGAIDPLATYRSSGYRERKAEERPAEARRGAGIV
jgi:L-rhamnose isomerase/sugar isomerase